MKKRYSKEFKETLIAFYHNVTADEYTEEHFIEGLKSIDHETFLKICYG